MKKIAIIPAKSNSSRIENKNFRPFYNGKSLLEIKVEQCIGSASLTIYTYPVIIMTALELLISMVLNLFLGIANTV